MKKMSLVFILSGVALGAAGCGHSSPTAPSQSASIVPASASVAVGVTENFTYFGGGGTCSATGGVLTQSLGNLQYTAGTIPGTYQITCPHASAPVTVVGPEAYSSPVGYLNAGDPNNPGTGIQVPAGAFQVEPLSFTPGRGSAFPVLDGPIGWSFSFSVACGVLDYDGAGYFPEPYISDAVGNAIDLGTYNGTQSNNVGGTHPCQTTVWQAVHLYTTPIAAPVYGVALEVWHGRDAGLGPIVLDPQPTPNAARDMVIGPIPTGWH